MPSSFLVAIPEDMLEQRMTIKVRSSGARHALLAASRWGTRASDAARCARRVDDDASAERRVGVRARRVAPASFATPRRRRTRRAS